jgi:hypothetical protein
MTNDLQALNRLRAVRGLGPIGTTDNSDQKREKAKKEKKAAKKKRVPNKIGDKRKEVNKQLKIMVPVYLRSHPICGIQSPVCTRIATCVNHTEGRGPNEILNEQTWEPSCSACNGYIEQYPKFNGGQHKKPRHHKKEGKTEK